MPVVVNVQGYGYGEWKSLQGMQKPSNYYGFGVVVLSSILGDGGGNFGLRFPNNGVINDANPTPCAASDSRDHGYIDAAFKWIESQSSLDSSKIFLTGFSQNSMFAFYVSVCWSSKVAGLWQGGSGLAKTGYTPVVPGTQAQCSFSERMKVGDPAHACCASAFCTECQYWPIYPKRCSGQKKLTSCIMAYTDDGVGCGSDWYAYEAMVAEGHDARLLSFAGPGGHKDPQNGWAWKVGCLGIVDSCSDACAASFKTCVGSQSGTGGEKYAACEGQLEAGSLSGCSSGCAPTIPMLEASETPVLSLSTGAFGTKTGLTVAAVPAPKPTCKAAWGSFAEAPHGQCKPSSSDLAKVAASKPQSCSSSSNTSSSSTGGSTSGGSSTGGSSTGGSTSGGSSTGGSSTTAAGATAGTNVGGSAASGAFLPKGLQLWMVILIGVIPSLQSAAA